MPGPDSQGIKIHSPLDINLFNPHFAPETQLDTMEDKPAPSLFSGGSARGDHCLSDKASHQEDGITKERPSRLVIEI